MVSYYILIKGNVYETKIFNTVEETMMEVDDEGLETNQTVVKIEFFVEVTNDPATCPQLYQIQDQEQQMELLATNEMKYALTQAGNSVTLRDNFGVSCLMDNCDIPDNTDTGITSEEWLTIIMAISGSLLVIIIFLSIAIHCLKKKYHVSICNLSNFLMLN